MRILHVIPSVDPRFGGPVEALVQMGRLHIELGHTVEAASADAPLASFLQSLPFPVHPCGASLASYRYSPALKRWLSLNGPRFDAAIVHGIWQYPLIAAHAALSGRVPYFVYTHGMLDPWFNDEFLFKHIKKTLYWHAFLRRSLNEAAGVVFTTEDELERSSRSFFPFRGKAMIAPLGIIPPPDDRRAQAEAVEELFPGLAARRFLLFFGRIHPKKGCDMLLRAFARIAPDFPHLHLVMAGHGDPAYLDSLHRLVRGAGLGARVHWTGHVAGPAKWGLLRLADAFVLPSHQENFAFAAIEAMAVNTPVLLSNKVQTWRSAVRYGAGIAEPDTQEGTGRLLRAWLTLGEKERAAVRQHAGECYRARFTASQAASTLLSEMQSRLRSGTARTAQVMQALCDNRGL